MVHSLVFIKKGIPASLENDSEIMKIQSQLLEFILKTNGCVNFMNLNLIGTTHSIILHSTLMPQFQFYRSVTEPPPPPSPHINIFLFHIASS